MDGNLPEEDKQPISGDHPNSIFSLFGKTHRMNVSEEATSVCSGDICNDERLDESYPDRISSMSEDLGLVWLHVVAPPEMETDLTSVSRELGQLRRRRRRGRGAQDDGRHARRPRRAQEPERRPPGPLPGVDRRHPAGPAPEPQLQAHAAAARALAVPPLGDRYRRQPNDAIDGLEPVLRGPGPARRALPAPRAADDVRGPAAAEAVEEAEGRGHVGRLADRRGGRPRGGFLLGRVDAGGFGATRRPRSHRSRCSSRRPARSARRSTTPTWRRSTSCRRCSKS